MLNGGMRSYGHIIVVYNEFFVDEVGQDIGDRPKSE